MRIRYTIGNEAGTEADVEREYGEVMIWTGQAELVQLPAVAEAPEIVPPPDEPAPGAELVPTPEMVAEPVPQMTAIEPGDAGEA